LSFALDPSLDCAALAARLAAQRRVQVRNVLSSDSADRLLDGLERDTPWSLTYYSLRGIGMVPGGLIGLCSPRR